MIELASIPAHKCHPSDVDAKITLGFNEGAVTPYVTHFQNMEDAFRASNPKAGKSMGNYFDDIGEALDDLKARVLRGY